MFDKRGGNTKEINILAIVVALVATMAFAQAAPYEQCILQTDYYNICLYGATYDYSSIYPLSVGVGTYGLSQAGGWRTTIGQKTTNDMGSQLAAMYQAEGTLANDGGINAINDQVATGHPIFVSRSSLYLMDFGGNGLEPGRIISSSGHYDMIIDLGNNRCCYLSSDSYEGLKDMVNHAKVVTGWGQFTFPTIN
jgi:hypothetical protein